jgi:ABC-type sugar transport system substrate-binding protein
MILDGTRDRRVFVAHIARRWVASVFVLTLALSGCRSDARRDRFRIGAVMPTGSTAVAQAVRRGMEAEAKQHGVELLWRDADTRKPTVHPVDQELENALELIQDEGVRLLIYEPYDALRAWDVVREAKSANIPIVAFDALPRGSDVAAYVTTDFVAAGEDAASVALERLIELRRFNIENQVNALVLEGAPGNEAERQTTVGFYRVLDTMDDARVVARTPVVTPTDAFQFTSSQLNNYAGNVQLLLVAATRNVSGAIIAARTRGVAEFLVSASVGAGEEASRLIIEGSHDYEVDLMPEQRGAFAVQVGLQLARGGSPSPDASVANGEVLVPAFYGPRRVISRENVGVMRLLWRNLYPQ